MNMVQSTKSEIPIKEKFKQVLLSFSPLIAFTIVARVFLYFVDLYYLKLTLLLFGFGLLMFTCFIFMANFFDLVTLVSLKVGIVPYDTALGNKIGTKFWNFVETHGLISMVGIGLITASILVLPLYNFMAAFYIWVLMFIWGLSINGSLFEKSGSMVGDVITQGVIDYLSVSETN